MAKSEAKPVPIDLGDGKPHALLYNRRGVVAAEDASGGRSIFTIVFAESSIGHLSRMIWAGLLHEGNSQQTLDWVTDQIFDAFTSEESISVLRFQSPIFEALMEAGIFKRRKKEDAAAGNGGGKSPPDPTSQAPESPSAPGTPQSSQPSSGSTAASQPSST